MEREKFRNNPAGINEFPSNTVAGPKNISWEKSSRREKNYISEDISFFQT